MSGVVEAKHTIADEVVVVSVSGYARSQGRTPVTFGPTDLVCCRTLQGHTGKVPFLVPFFFFVICFACLTCSQFSFSLEVVACGWLAVMVTTWRWQQ